MPDVRGVRHAGVHRRPHRIREHVHEVRPMADMFIADITGLKAPFLFTRDDAKRRLEGQSRGRCQLRHRWSVACTLRPSTIADPLYGYDAASESECAFDAPNAITVMAVDNLPCELPRDARNGFGKDLLAHVIPARERQPRQRGRQCHGNDTGRLARAQVPVPSRPTSTTPERPVSSSSHERMAWPSVVPAEGLATNVRQPPALLRRSVTGRIEPGLEGAPQRCRPKLSSSVCATAHNHFTLPIDDDVHIHLSPSPGVQARPNHGQTSPQAEPNCDKPIVLGIPLSKVWFTC